MGLRSAVGRRVFGRGAKAAPYDWAGDEGLSLGLNGAKRRSRAGAPYKSRNQATGRFNNSAPFSNFDMPRHNVRVNGKFATAEQAATAGKQAAAGVVAPRKSWARRHPVKTTALAGIGAATLLSGMSLKRNTGPGAIGNGYRPVGTSSGGF